MEQRPSSMAFSCLGLSQKSKQTRHFAGYILQETSVCTTSSVATRILSGSEELCWPPNASTAMSQVTAAVRLLGPRVPLILKTAVFQTLGFSDESSKWDLRMAVIITTLRSIMEGSSSSITKQQNFSLRDPGVKGPIWISTAILPTPEDDVRQLLFKVIKEMNVSGNETFIEPSLDKVEAEWTGYRSGVGKHAPVPTGLSEKDKYDAMMKEVKSNVTILYFHGGAYCESCISRPWSCNYEACAAWRTGYP